MWPAVGLPSTIPHVTAPGRPRPRANVACGVSGTVPGWTGPTTSAELIRQSPGGVGHSAAVRFGMLRKDGPNHVDDPEDNGHCDAYKASPATGPAGIALRGSMHGLRSVARAARPPGATGRRAPGLPARLRWPALIVSGCGAGRVRIEPGRQPLRFVELGAKARQLQSQRLIVQPGRGEPHAGAPDEPPSVLQLPTHLAEVGVTAALSEAG